MHGPRLPRLAELPDPRATRVERLEGPSGQKAMASKRFFGVGMGGGGSTTCFGAAKSVKRRRQQGT